MKTAEPGTQFRGPDGQKVGAFIPPRLVSEWQSFLERRRRMIDEACEAVTLEELKAADAAGGEYTMEDVMKLLEQKP